MISRYFVDEPSLVAHTKSKVHRRRLKELKEGAYTQKDAELAIGLTTENKRVTVAVSEEAAQDVLMF